MDKYSKPYYDRSRISNFPSELPKKSYGLSSFNYNKNADDNLILLKHTSNEIAKNSFKPNSKSKQNSFYKNDVPSHKEPVKITRKDIINSDLTSKKLTSHKSITNININTKVIQRVGSQKLIKQNPVDNRDFNKKIGTINTNNYSSKSNLINKNIGKDDNYSCKFGLTNNAYDNGSNSSVRMAASAKPASSHINKSNLNPNFRAPSKGNGNTKNDSDDRPFTTQKSRFRMESTNQEALTPCKECGRSFREEALIKHIRICKKVFKTKRKKFDTKKKRIIDSEHAMILRHAEKAENNPKLKQIKARKKENWKIQSEILRNAARASRREAVSSSGLRNVTRGYGNIQNNYNKGGSTANYDPLTYCRLCDRKYNEIAFDKHLGYCQKKNKENQIKSNLSKPASNNKYIKY